MYQRTRRFPVSPAELAAISQLIASGTVSYAGGRQIYRYLKEYYILNEHLLTEEDK
jgi:hypothetical protein